MHISQGETHSFSIGTAARSLNMIIHNSKLNLIPPRACHAGVPEQVGTRHCEVEAARISSACFDMQTLVWKERLW